MIPLLYPTSGPAPDASFSEVTATSDLLTWQGSTFALQARGQQVSLHGRAYRATESAITSTCTLLTIEPGGSLALSWTEGMRQLASEADTPLQRALLGVLGGQTRAYFWELPPASARADPRFEFVLTPAVRPAHTRERANCACRWDCARSNPIRVHSLMFICRALCEAAAEVLLPEGKYGGLSAFKVVARVWFWATNVVCPARAQRVPWCLARG